MANLYADEDFNYPVVEAVELGFTLEDFGLPGGLENRCKRSGGGTHGRRGVCVK